MNLAVCSSSAQRVEPNIRDSSLRVRLYKDRWLITCSKSIFQALEQLLLPILSTLNLIEVILVIPYLFFLLILSLCLFLLLPSSHVIAI